MNGPRLAPEAAEPEAAEPEAQADFAHGEAHPERVALRAAREHTIQRLSEAFAGDVLTLEAFENRVDQAFACRTRSDFEALVRDLGPTLEQRALMRVEADLAPSPEPSAQPNIQRVALSVLGNVERRGRFVLPRLGRALAVLGNVELDLREIAFPAGVTELRVSAVLGNVEIVVPPNLAVETDGSGILGSFATVSRMPLEAGDEPVLRIRGNAVLGNVEIRTLPRTEPRALPERR